MSKTSLTMNPAVPPRDDILIKIEIATGYTFTNPVFCLKALQTAGCATAGGQKSLAQVGDAALRLALVTIGYGKGASRGQIDSALRTKASNSHLADQGFKRGFDGCVYRIGGVDVSMKMMATAVQAVLGAVFLDCNKNMSVFLEVIEVLDLSWN
ncbi:hypothetical protein I7I50_08090 [Histoplasma capsulatum G186AR]|uniref:RNase III domain-containing protein n=1 Tax=Ajellomyces capsulatus TaxID=5037 RepID=A0A8H7YKE3_AJECA|nr:hypothetical protein I7I52_08606 [Histoplasma capsulatum]QSS68618.1 hypothetical protein I7I50_08090 [Histoplasma capsulatum G186AR]